MKNPVRVFLPVKRNQRGGRFRLEWWRVDLLKDEHFTEADLTPFVIQSSCDETSWRSRWVLGLESVERVSRAAYLRPYEIAFSKTEPLYTALQALGWQRCEAPALK